MDAHDGGTGTVPCSDFLQRQRISDSTGFRPAILFGHQHAEEAELAHRFQFFLGETAFPVTRSGARGKPFPRKVAGHISDLLLGFSEHHRRLPPKSRSVSGASPAGIGREGCP